jgi:hypothetical protein
MAELMLFRAPPEFGAFNTWEASHFESIGRVEVVAAAIRALFAESPLRWSRYDESGWIFAEGKDQGRTIDLMFRAAEHGGVDHLVARKADSVTLVKLVEMLELNFVFDPARGKYLDPYRCDVAGQSLVTNGVYPLTEARRPK